MSLSTVAEYLPPHPITGIVPRPFKRKCTMCRLEFPDFPDKIQDMRKQLNEHANRLLLATAPDGSQVTLKFDEDRCNEPLRHRGHISIPVLINAIQHVLAYDPDKKVWYLPCGPLHFDWCLNRRRGRKA